MPFNPTLRQLRFLKEVAHQSSFTRAGEALYVSQPTVSSAIGELERQVGLPLFEPIGRRVQLTEAGRILNGHGERVLAELADAERALLGLQAGDAGRLVVGASSTPGTYLLPSMLAAFRREHPRVEVVLEIGDTEHVLRRVLAGQLDLGVVGEASFDPVLQAELLRTETLVLIMVAGHPLAQRERVSPRDLEGEPFILRERGSSTRGVLERTLEEQGIRPRVVMELGSTEAVKKSVAAGLGISLVSEHAVELEERFGVLATRRIPELNPRRGIYTVWRRTLQLQPLHQRFLRTLRSPSGP
jgi:LysR family transcriptional regulator, low CO2-responsive transcriptional regulator